MIFQLNDNDIVFPNPALAEEDGLLAIGGDLYVSRLMQAYRMGIFPWFAPGDPIYWYSPPERCVIFPQKIRISNSMQKFLKKDPFRITKNEAFHHVIRQCKSIARKDQQGTWITDEMEAAYINLYRAGYAHSVEVWQDDDLVGGIYGVVINNIFCGESMFSSKPNATKAALIWLCRQSGFRLIDCQMRTDHLVSMGAEMIPRRDFFQVLNDK